MLHFHFFLWLWEIVSVLNSAPSKEVAIHPPVLNGIKHSTFLEPFFLLLSNGTGSLLMTHKARRRRREWRFYAEFYCWHHNEVLWSLPRRTRSNELIYETELTTTTPIFFCKYISLELIFIGRNVFFFCPFLQLCSDDFIKIFWLCSVHSCGNGEEKKWNLLLCMQTKPIIE